MSDDIKSQIDKIGQSWEASKKAQDELDAKVEKGLGGVAEIKAKQEKIDRDLDAALKFKEDFEAIKKTNEDLEKSVARLCEGLGSEKGVKSEEKKALDEGLVLWLKSGMPEHIDGIRGLDNTQRKSLQSNIDPQGGYSIQPFMGTMEGRIFPTSPVRSLATVVTMGTSNEYVGSYDDDEAEAYMAGETSTRTSSDTADLGEYRIPVKEMYARFTITERNLEDSMFSLENWANEKVNDKFNRKEANLFVSGSGPLNPQGLITGTVNTSTPSGYVRGQVGTITTAGSTAITSDEVIQLGEQIETGYLPNAYYLMNRFTRGYIRRLKDGQGNYLWVPSYQMGVADELNGQRVSIFEDMPSIATGAIALALADVRRAYKIVDRVGISMLRDPFSEADNGKILFRARKRFGAGIVNWGAIKYLKQL